MKNELHYLRHSLAQHRRFIEAMRAAITAIGVLPKKKGCK